MRRCPQRGAGHALSTGFAAAGALGERTRNGTCMTTHHIIRGPGQLLATIPNLLGFDPRESIVVIGTRGSSDMGILMRVDRADCLIPEVVDPLARSLAGHLVRDGASQAILVTYTEADVRVACDAADAVRAVLQDSLTVVEQWAVSRGRYFCPGCADDACCPADGLPLPSPVEVGSTGMRLAGTTRHERTLAVIDVDAKGKRSATRAIQRWRGRKVNDPDRWREESWSLWLDTLATAAHSETLLPAPTAGKLIAALEDLRVRDAAVLSLIPGSEQAALGVLRGSDDALVAAALSRVLEPAHAVRPDPTHSNAARVLCATLCAYAPRKQRAPMIALLAFMAWWDADATRTRDLCDQALSVDPGYTLAELLDATVRCHLEPGWMRERARKGDKP